MINPRRLVLLVALTAFGVSLFPITGSAIAPKKTHQMCASDEDCQQGFHCSFDRHKYRTRHHGVCVGG